MSDRTPSMDSPNPIIVNYNSWTMAMQIKQKWSSYRFICFKMKIELCRPVSGGSMNPARTLGPAIASQRYDSLWVYFLGPVLGTLAGGSAYTFIRLTDKQPQEGSQKLSSFKLRRLQSQGSLDVKEDVGLENV